MQRTHVNQFVKFNPEVAANTRFVQIDGQRKTFFRVVVKGIGDKFIMPTDDGVFRPFASPRSEALEGFDGKTAKEVWLKLAESIRQNGVFPEAGRKTKKAKVVAVKATKPVKAAKKVHGEIVGKSRKGKVRGEDFDFEQMSANM